MKQFILIFATLFLSNAYAQVSKFQTSASELRAVLEVPVLSELLNHGEIIGISKVPGTNNIFEVDAGYCKAKIRVSKSMSITSTPTAESLGAECGP